MRFSLSALVALTAFILVAGALFSSGCLEDDASACNSTMLEIDSLEKKADNRLKVMDFSSVDEILRSQIRASQDQYREVIDMVYDLGPSPCLSGFAYENRVKSLQLKIDFLDIATAMIEADGKAEAIFHTSTPEFRKGLIEVMNDYENIRQRIVFLRIMGNDIDTTLLSPEYTGVIEIVDGKASGMLESVDNKLSFLREYR